jgi:preprotein translocase subunit SecG
MLYIFYAAIIGIVLGALSAYHTKAFLSGLVSTLIVGSILMRPIVLAGAAASNAMGKSNIFGVYIEGIAMLPALLKTSVLLLPVFFFSGRFLAWGYKEIIHEETPETREEKRARVIREHNWTAEKDKKFSSKIRIRR